jgi:SAM-dependent methyltransferase
MSTHPEQSTYAEDPRADIQPHLASLATPLSGSVLDVGCGRGGFGPTLRAALGPRARLVGLEAVPESAAIARVGHEFDEVVDGYFPDALAERDDRFDLICFNDVLEHIIDPWRILREARERLTPTGRVLAAIPNIGFAPAVVDLLRGRWDYTDDGLLDRTHVRFFTRGTMVEMFERAGLAVELCQGMNGLYDTRWAADPVAPRRMAKKGLARVLGDRQFLHFLVVGRAR